MRVLRAIVAVVALAGGVAGAPASATVLTFSYSGVVTGTTPASTPPWLTATFDDVVDPPLSNGVRVTLTSSLEASTEFFSRIMFNLNPQLDASRLTYTGGTTSPDTPFPTLVKDTDGIQAPEGQLFDFEFDFHPQTTTGRLNGTDFFQAILLYDSGGTKLTAFDFDFQSVSNGRNPNPNQFTVAHVQGIALAPPDIELQGVGLQAIEPNETSGWIFGAQPLNGVPEPGTLALLGIAAIGLVASRRRVRS